jgi:hypothetical protein
MKKLIAALALAALPLGAAHAYFDGSVGTVGGADGYTGINAAAKIGGDSFSIDPSYSSYKQDGLDNTFSTYGLGLGYAVPLFSVDLDAATTPKQNDYGNYTMSADAIFSLSPTGGHNSRIAGPHMGAGSDKGEGVARIDVGAGLAYTSHDLDSYANRVGETDGSIFAGALFLGTQVSARYTKNLHYSETLNDESAPLVVNLPGSMIETQGYLNQAMNLRVDWTLIPAVTPYVSYTAAQYKLAQPTSKTYQFGAQVGLDMLNINAAYQVQDPGDGYSSKSYFTVGAGLNF